jgi:hypothetical protein
MEVLFSNQFIAISIDKEAKLLQAVWSKESGKIDETFFRFVNEKYVEYAQTYTIEFALIDTINFQYTIRPELQEWVANTILPSLIGAGWRKIAFMMSDDFVTQLSVEQTMEERELPFDVKYFSDTAKALNWLK